MCTKVLAEGNQASTAKPQAPGTRNSSELGRSSTGSGGLQDYSEGIPVMFLRRPSLRHFRTLWVEPREDEEKILEHNQRLFLEGLGR